MREQKWGRSGKNTAFTVGEKYKITSGFKISILEVLERKDKWLTIAIDGGKPVKVRAWPVFGAGHNESILMSDYNAIYSYDREAE